jgi:DNA helicase-2/ATP-dependent DNA helicase PcrA
VDFEDLIETARVNFTAAPNDPAVIIVDEAQDLTPSQVKLIEQWGEAAEWYLMAGDDDQTIYGFTGASPEHFWDPLPENRDTVLAQSYRVPREVHRRAVGFIEQAHQRKAKTYHPRDFDGQVEELWDNYKFPDDVLSQVVYPHLKEGRSVMILASCSYMLQTIVMMLKRFGDPFENPYRRNRRDWNPLYSTRQYRSAKDYLVSFLSIGSDPPYWDVPNLLIWTKHLGVGSDGLIRGKGRAGLDALKEALEKHMPGLHTSRNVLSEILNPGAIEPALNRNIDWFLEHLVGGKQGPMMYPLSIYKRHGAEMLTQKPQIVVGTIHSVKGGEADVVVLYPDMSTRAMETMMRSPAEEDAMRRVFYVGMTRAKHSLYLMSPVYRRQNVMFMEL